MIKKISLKTLKIELRETTKGLKTKISKLICYKNKFLKKKNQMKYNNYILEQINNYILKNKFLF